MAKFAIADPPYYGRAVRHYGKGGVGIGYGKGQADNHPEAYLWDIKETHFALVDYLEDNFDGYAISMSPHNLGLYLSKIEIGTASGYRVCAWNKMRGVPSASRIHNLWEPVIVKTPKDRTGHKSGVKTHDILQATAPRIGFAGAKPEAWTKWVIDLMGARPEEDEIIDLFIGSGLVTNVLKGLKNES